MKYLIVLLLLVGCEETLEQKAKRFDETTITLCWENQAKKSNAPDEARFIAGACEILEARFKEKYKR